MQFGNYILSFDETLKPKYQITCRYTYKVHHNTIDVNNVAFLNRSTEHWCSASNSEIIHNSNKHQGV